MEQIETPAKVNVTWYIMFYLAVTGVLIAWMTFYWVKGLSLLVSAEEILIYSVVWRVANLLILLYLASNKVRGVVLILPIITFLPLLLGFIGAVTVTEVIGVVIAIYILVRQ